VESIRYEPSPPSSIDPADLGRYTYDELQRIRDALVSIIEGSGTMLDISRGIIPGQSQINKFGFAPDFDTGDNEITIWDGADDGNADKMVYTYSTTADITDIVSSSASDTFEVEVQGLDTDYNQVTQTKTLTGTTSVALDTALIRVFRMKNNSGTTAVGKIQCGVGSTTTSFSTANLRAEIAIGREQTLMSIYTVPNGKTAYMTGWYFYTAGTSRSADYNITVMARPSGGVFQIKHHGSILDGASNEISHKYIPYPSFTEKTDIESRAQITAVGVTAAGISAGFDLILVDNA